MGSVAVLFRTHASDERDRRVSQGTPRTRSARRRRGSGPRSPPPRADTGGDHSTDHVLADHPGLRLRSLPRRTRRQRIGDGAWPWFTVGENLVKGAFLDPRRRELRPNWERSLGGTVAAPRANVGPDLDDPRLTELVGELSLRSQEFRQLWARHDVRPKGSGSSVMHHPQVGRLELFYTKLPIPDTDRQTLSIYHAAPGTPSERALALLATTTVREREPDRTLTD